jgi:D-arabinose 1-dehydrogenase-like Zn-dependent alcohol dehydrogenase
MASALPSYHNAF